MSRIPIRLSARIDEAGSGVYEVKAIAAGKGSSGYYGADMLERAAHLFDNVQMFWNHPSADEEANRPERSLRDLAGVFTNARFDTAPDGPGVYGIARVFAPFREAVREMAPYIGLSIYGFGTSEPGEVDGEPQDIVTLEEIRSVDFVTLPGAGGKVLALFESMRNQKEGSMEHEGIVEEQPEAVETEVAEAVEEAIEQPEAEAEPVGETEPDEVEEADGNIVERLGDLEQKVAQLADAVAKLAKGKKEADAEEAVQEALSRVDLPDIAKRRIAEAIDRDGDIAGQVDVLAEAEREYIAALGTPAKVSGLGASEPQAVDYEKAIQESIAAIRKRG